MAGSVPSAGVQCLSRNKQLLRQLLRVRAGSGRVMPCLRQEARPLAHKSVSRYTGACDLHTDVLKSARIVSAAKNLTTGAGN